jgi:hypothetical protein
MLEVIAMQHAVAGTKDQFAERRQRGDSDKGRERSFVRQWLSTRRTLRTRPQPRGAASGC